MKTLDIEREIADQGIPVSMQATYRKAMAGNRPAAVKSMCWHCQGWEDARKAIRHCADVGCPLHAVRPYQTKDDARTDAEITSPLTTKSLGFSGGCEAVLAALDTETYRSKSDILFLSDISPALWTEIINSLLSQGLVERQGERRSTVYRRKP